MSTRFLFLLRVWHTKSMVIVEEYTVWMIPNWFWILLFVLLAIGPLMMLYQHCRKARSISLPIAILAAMAASSYLYVNDVPVAVKNLTKIIVFAVVYFVIQKLKRLKKTHIAVKQ